MKILLLYHVTYIKVYPTINPINKMKIINPDNPKLIIIVENPLNNFFQLVASDSPINPSTQLTIHIPNTIFNGCIFNQVVVKSITDCTDIAIKNSAIHTKESIKDHKLIFIFIVLSFYSYYMFFT